MESIMPVCPHCGFNSDVEETQCSQCRRTTVSYGRMTGYALFGVLAWFTVRMAGSFLLYLIWRTGGEVAILLTILWGIHQLVEVYKGWRVLRTIPKLRR